MNMFYHQNSVGIRRGGSLTRPMRRSAGDQGGNPSAALQTVRRTNWQPVSGPMSRSDGENERNRKQSGTGESHQEAGQSQPPQTSPCGTVKRRKTKKDQHVADYVNSGGSDQPRFGLENGDGGLLGGVQCRRYLRTTNRHRPRPTHPREPDQATVNPGFEKSPDLPTPALLRARDRPIISGCFGSRPVIARATWIALRGRLPSAPSPFMWALSSSASSVGMLIVRRAAADFGGPMPPAPPAPTTVASPSLPDLILADSRDEIGNRSS